MALKLFVVVWVEDKKNIKATNQYERSKEGDVRPHLSTERSTHVIDITRSEKLKVSYQKYYGILVASVCFTLN